MTAFLERAILEALKENKSPGQTGDVAVFRPPINKRKLNNLRAPVGLYYVASKDFEEQLDGSAVTETVYAIELWYPNVEGAHDAADRAADRIYSLLKRRVTVYTVDSDNHQEQGVPIYAGGTSGAVIKVITATVR